MGITFAASSKSANAPDIEPGIYPARFDKVEPKVVEQSQFSPDCFEWTFTLYEGDEPIYDEGDPLEVTGLTSQSTNVKSKTTPRAVRYLQAIMTPEEFASFAAGGGIDADALLGRMVQVQVIVKDSGWPAIENVIAAPRTPKKHAAPKAAA